MTGRSPETAAKVVASALLALGSGVAPAIAQTADQLVGRWGLASYFREPDAAGIAASAARQCGAPYIIARGPSGGVMLHSPDATKTTEHVVKPAAIGRATIGPPGEAGGAKDREIVSFDGRTLVLRWLDPGVASRYGTMVFVRCGR